ncbi:hypothetical protein HI914_06454 [Erysiphe necator]|nr:hypothetical protein HI914_06454 [Erysiphe necator]
MHVLGTKGVLFASLLALWAVQITDATRTNTANARYLLTEDGFGVTSYGFQCLDQVFLKYDIFSAAKQYCDSIAIKPELVSQSSQEAGYRRMLSPETIKAFVQQPRRLSTLTLIPILEDVTLYPYITPSDSRENKDSQVVTDKPYVGPYRLIIDQNCDVVGALSDLDYTSEVDGGIVTGCKLLRSPSDLDIHSSRSSSSWDGSPFRSPFRNHNELFFKAPPNTPIRSALYSLQNSPRIHPHVST